MFFDGQPVATGAVMNPAHHGMPDPFSWRDERCGNVK